MKCRHCGSKNLSFSKWIQWGPNMGKSFHYRIKCADCRKSYSVKRDKEMFEKVKNLRWQVSKTTYKHLAKHSLTIKDI